MLCLRKLNFNLIFKYLSAAAVAKLFVKYFRVFYVFAESAQPLNIPLTFTLLKTMWMENLPTSIHTLCTMYILHENNNFIFSAHDFRVSFHKMTRRVIIGVG